MPAEFNFSTNDELPGCEEGFRQLGWLVFAVILICGFIQYGCVPAGHKFSSETAFREVVSMIVQNDGISRSDIKLVNHSMQGQLVDWTDEISMNIRAEGRLFFAECYSSYHPIMCEYYEQGSIRERRSSTDE